MFAKVKPPSYNVVLISDDGFDTIHQCDGQTDGHVAVAYTALNMR